MVECHLCHLIGLIVSSDSPVTSNPVELQIDSPLLQLRDFTDDFLEQAWSGTRVSGLEGLEGTEAVAVDVDIFDVCFIDPSDCLSDRNQLCRVYGVVRRDSKLFFDVCSSDMVCTSCLAIFAFGGISEYGGFLSSLLPDVRHRSSVHLHLACFALFDLFVESGVDLRCALMPRRIWCCLDWFEIGVYLVVLADGFAEALLFYLEILVLPGTLQNLLCRMPIHRCDLLRVFEAQIQSSQIQWHLPTVYLDCSVRCSPHRSTTYPQRLHLNYIQFLKDVVSNRVVGDGAVINSGSDEGSVDEHQCCLVRSPSLVCDFPHQVDDWLAFLHHVFDMTAPCHSDIEDQTEEFRVVDEVEI